MLRTKAMRDHACAGASGLVPTYCREERSIGNHLKNIGRSSVRRAFSFKVGSSRPYADKLASDASKLRKQRRTLQQIQTLARFISLPWQLVIESRRQHSGGLIHGSAASWTFGGMRGLTVGRLGRSTPF